MSNSIKAILLGLAIALAVPITSASASPPGAAKKLVIKRGMRFVAERDVVLREAELSAGSKVTVIAVARKAGKVVSVGIELKDGHVLHGVAIAVLRKNFRPVKR